MRLLFRCLGENAGPWRVWAPLLLIAAALPPLLVGMPLVEKQLIDGVFLARRPDLLAGTLLAYCALWILATLGGIARTTLQAYQTELIGQRLHQRLLAHASTLSLAYWHREHSGRLTALFYNDAPRLTGIFNATVVSGLAGLGGALLSAVVMFSLNWQLAIVTALAPPLVSGLAVVLTRPLRPAARKVQEKAAEISERFEENLTGLREIVAFGRERARGAQFATSLQELVRLRMRLTFLNASFTAGQSVFSFVVYLAILGYGGYLVLHGETTLGTVIAMRTLFNQTFTTAKQLFGLFRDVQMAMASVDRVYAFLDETPRVRERERAWALPDVRGEVVFDHVSFAYQPDRPVLHDVSLTVKPGEVVALVGPSGAGKSTLVSLVSRFYDPTAGRVLLDGIDLRDLTLDSLRREIGIVFQDTFLFATSIRENLAFGRPGASEDAIRAAARTANALEFIERLPEGLDTRVGQRGVQLSEGQKQRLAIARALLRDPRILILDEPTSALDARSESLLQAALHDLMRGRTTFVVAHRLRTIQRADKIVVLDGGRVVEQGAHADLLGRSGLYRELYELQFAGAGAPGDAAGSNPAPAPKTHHPAINAFGVEALADRTATAAG